MRKLIDYPAVALMSVLILTACNMPVLQQPSTLAVPPGVCGDSVCEWPEDAESCPEDCPVAEAAAGTFGEGNVYLVDNPANGACLYVKVVHPQIWDGEVLPALVLIPGSNSDSSGFLDGPAQKIANAGFVVVVFDPDGRGRSTGEEDYGGFIQQDGLAAVVRQVAGLPDIDSSSIGLVSYSYGVTMASGMLARYPDLPVRFLIDWEGPADRNDTGGCDEHHIGHLAGIAGCDDESFWSQREALSFISQINVPYQRIQSEKDHVQPDNTHAVTMLNTAMSGGVPWVRLNNLAPNQTFDAANPPTMLPEDMDGQIEMLVVTYVQELLLSLE
ncbi:MAG: hypothetical protein JXB07_21055 [Anaerolineae bacterium]|nr:hypothetical protein [Anaerolineae bacterium]